MHQVTVDGLEDALSGKTSRDFEAHLAACAECRKEVAALRKTSELFAPLRAEEPIGPLAGFAARVMARVGAQAEPSFWNLLSLESAFTRRIALASLLVLATLGGILVSQESSFDGRPGPAEIMAASTDEEGPANRDRMLVTLTSYQP
jgi:anti-sigma factor RsiW